MSEKRSRFGIGLLAITVILIGLIGIGAFRSAEALQPGRFWIAGAAAIGLLAGLTTGLSKQTGSGVELLKFLGAGLLVPLLGGVVALLEKSETVTEKTTYTGTLVSEKSTSTVTAFPEGIEHPLGTVGSFFAAFAIAACLGLVAGACLREEDVIDINVTNGGAVGED
jgi:hypothetical protein